MNVQKIALIVRKGRKFSLQFFLNGYVPLGWRNSVWTTMPPGMILRKRPKNIPWTSKKKSEKVKFLSKLFFQMPIWRQKSRFDNKAATFPPQIRHFLAQSRKLFHKVNIMFLSKCFSGHVKFIFYNFVEKFRQSWKHLRSNTIVNWKRTFWKIISSKSSRTFRMQFWQNWRNFFFRSKIFFTRTRS